MKGLTAVPRRFGWVCRHSAVQPMTDTQHTANRPFLARLNSPILLQVQQNLGAPGASIAVPFSVSYQ